MSTANPYPGQEEQDKKSEKTRGVVDHVEFKKDGDKQIPIGEYYIGVVGYQYSIFEVAVRLQFEGEKELERDMSFFHLSEGFARHGKMRDEHQEDHYKFRVDMEKGMEENIKLDV